MSYTVLSLDVVAGNGSDRRRKDIITGGFGSPNLFVSHRRRLQELFKVAADALQEKILAVVHQQLAFVMADIETLKSENVILESERNPDFRLRLEEEMRVAKPEVERIGRLLSELGVGRQREVTPGDGLTY
jgi:hypothetical protein